MTSLSFQAASLDFYEVHCTDEPDRFVHRYCRSVLHLKDLHRSRLFCLEISDASSQARLSWSASCLPGVIYLPAFSPHLEPIDWRASSLLLLFSSYEDKCYHLIFILLHFYFFCFIMYSDPLLRFILSLSKSGASVREPAVRKELFSSAAKFPSLSGSLRFSRSGNIAAIRGSWLGLVPVDQLTSKLLWPQLRSLCSCLQCIFGVLF